jgi:hypothetical protein
VKKALVLSQIIGGGVAYWLSAGTTNTNMRLPFIMLGAIVGLIVYLAAIGLYRARKWSRRHDNLTDLMQ